MGNILQFSPGDQTKEDWMAVILKEIKENAV